nr:hypothetical protein [Rhizobium leguminosarum]
MAEAKEGGKCPTIDACAIRSSDVQIRRGGVVRKIKALCSAAPGAGDAAVDPM